MTEEELSVHLKDEDVSHCISILKKGNLIEEQWRMPEPGKKPVKEFRATYNKFRANFQCNLTDLSDLLYIAVSNDEQLRVVVEKVEEGFPAATLPLTILHASSVSAPPLSRASPSVSLISM